jgi:RNA polymerase sigma-70 factor (ECF subfamily)
LAEDVVQDAGVVALKQLDRFEIGTSFIAWMSQIVRYHALNQSRKRTRRKTKSVDPTTLASEVVNPSRNTKETLDAKINLPPDQTIFDDEVMKALQSLRDIARACLLLRTLHQLSYADIAEMLEIAEGTVMSHVYRSKDRLRHCLGPHFNKS